MLMIDFLGMRGYKNPRDRKSVWIRSLKIRHDYFYLVSVGKRKFVTAQHIAAKYLISVSRLYQILRAY